MGPCSCLCRHPSFQLRESDISAHPPKVIANRCHGFRSRSRDDGYTVRRQILPCGESLDQAAGRGHGKAVCFISRPDAPCHKSCHTSKRPCGSLGKAQYLRQALRIFPNVYLLLFGSMRVVSVALRKSPSNARVINPSKAHLNVIENSSQLWPQLLRH